jgi:hypothetical protein
MKVVHLLKACRGLNPLTFNKHAPLIALTTCRI